MGDAPTPAQIYAAAVTEIQLGIAMARAAGVVCGSPRNIRVTRDRTRKDPTDV